MTRRGSAARCVVAGLSAFVMIGCMLLVSWHRATVSHGRCAEHGEELHLESAADQSAAPRAQALDQAEIAASPWTLEDGDHHCQLLATAHQPLAAAVHPPSVDAPAAVERALPLAGVAATSSSVALYRLAPKTSPPV